MLSTGATRGGWAAFRRVVDEDHGGLGFTTHAPGEIQNRAHLLRSVFIGAGRCRGKGVDSDDRERSLALQRCQKGVLDFPVG